MKDEMTQTTQTALRPGFSESLVFAIIKIHEIEELLCSVKNPPQNGITPDYHSILKEIAPLVNMTRGALDRLLERIYLDGYEKVMAKEEFFLAKKEEEISP